MANNAASTPCPLDDYVDKLTNDLRPKLKVAIGQAVVSTVTAHIDGDGAGASAASVGGVYHVPASAPIDRAAMERQHQEHIRRSQQAPGVGMVDPSLMVDPG